MTTHPDRAALTDEIGRLTLLRNELRRQVAALQLEVQTERRHLHDTTSTAHVLRRARDLASFIPSDINGRARLTVAAAEAGHRQEGRTA